MYGLFIIYAFTIVSVVGFLSGIFSPDRDNFLQKIFKSAETVNVKLDVYEFGDKGQ
jgi:hypothetical protein